MQKEIHTELDLSMLLFYKIQFQSGCALYYGCEQATSGRQKLTKRVSQ